MSYLIAIGGGSGSGKTFIANCLSSNLPHNAGILSFDNYYKDQGHLPPLERAKINYDDLASLDVDLFLEHVEALHQGKAIDVPQYDFATHTRKKETVRLEPHPYVIVEGILVLCLIQEKTLFDFNIFVQADDDIRLARRVLRDIKERGRKAPDIIAQYLASVRPMHLKYVVPSKEKADFVFINNDNNGIDEVQMEKIVSRIMNLR